MLQPRNPRRNRVKLRTNRRVLFDRANRRRNKRSAPQPASRVARGRNSSAPTVCRAAAEIRSRERTDRRYQPRASLLDQSKLNHAQPLASIRHCRSHRGLRSSRDQRVSRPVGTPWISAAAALSWASFLKASPAGRSLRSKVQRPLAFTLPRISMSWMSQSIWSVRLNHV